MTLDAGGKPGQAHAVTLDAGASCRRCRHRGDALPASPGDALEPGQADAVTLDALPAIASDTLEPGQADAVTLDASASCRQALPALARPTP